MTHGEPKLCVAQLIAIAKYLGTDDYKTFIRKYNFPYNSKYPVEFLKSE